MQDKCAGGRMAFCGVRVVEVGPASLPAAPEGRTNAPRRDLTGENDTNRPRGGIHPTRPLFAGCRRSHRRRSPRPDCGNLESDTRFEKYQRSLNYKSTFQIKFELVQYIYNLHINVRQRK